MSEEILKALMQFFAIITRQVDDQAEDHRKYVVQFLNLQISQAHIDEYLNIYLEQSKPKEKKRSASVEKKKRRLTLSSDSVKILGICKKINKTLNQEQKAIVLVRLFEFLLHTNNYSENSIEILVSAADVFNIEEEDYKTIEYGILKQSNNIQKFEGLAILTSSNNTDFKTDNIIKVNAIDGEIKIIKVAKLDTLFMLYNGKDELFLNGLPVISENIHLLSRGSVLKLANGETFYYSDIASQFLGDSIDNKIGFEANDINLTFPNGVKGLRSVSLNETGGKLVALMGSSGAGKTTLLNVFSGLIKPTTGSVKINRINVHSSSEKLKGVIGYIPQDDLLIEELSVFDNLYHNAQLCFDNLDEDALQAKVNKTLTDVGLLHVKDIKVGSPLDKSISGGQRKRLNIALELIREPSVLFVDEPTSGLSSKDSENIMELLKMQSLKGNLVFVVIHQPSSEIYKMFSKLLILDVGGYPIYYGNPVEAVIYFKQKTYQLDSDIGECEKCGNVNPELIFNLIEAEVVDEKGEFTGVRKTTPEEWNTKYLEGIRKQSSISITEKPTGNLHIPKWVKQVKVFLTRDLKSKLANRQYMLINILEAPFLAILLGYLIKYIDPLEKKYIFSLNKNIPAFIFMAVVVTLFMGLSLSAEEILKDRKILKREKFLNLSWSAYLSSKIVLLFLFTLIQTFLFLFIGKFILEFNDLHIEHWAIVFSLGCFAVVFGLLISSLFKTAVAVYILIPMILIPQMILSGAIFKFDELNKFFGSENKVPIIADLMPSRWGYEALMVSTYTNNKFNKHFFEVNANIKNLNYLQLYYIPKLNDILLFEKAPKNRAIVKEEILQSKLLSKYLSSEKIEVDNLFKPKNILEKIKLELNKQDQIKQTITDSLLGVYNSVLEFKNVKKTYHNDYIENIVTNKYAKEDLIVSEEKIVRKKGLVYDGSISDGLNYRTHFFAPNKNLFKKTVSTTTFNIIVIWTMSLLTFLLLRFRIVGKVINTFKRN